MIPLFLNMGLTIACFREDGKVEVLYLRFISLHIVPLRVSDIPLYILAGSYPLVIVLVNGQTMAMPRRAAIRQLFLF